MGVKLKVCGLSVEYGSYAALEGLDFSIEKEDYVALIGPNGAGKSSLLRCISRVLKPSKGVVFLNERQLQRMPLREMARLVGVVPQNTSVDFDFTVEEIVSMGRYPHLGRFQRDREQDKEVVRKSMEITGIAHLSRQPVSSLSGGERQRVIIARALAQEPELLLLDEPTANLDINYQVEFLELARKLNREKGITIIAAIHDLNLAAQFFDRFILLSDKKILSLGKPEEVLTSENINKAYGTPVVVQRNPLHGKLSITVLKRLDHKKKGGKETGLKVHLVGGGEEAVPVLLALLEAGFRPTIGPLTREDSGHQLASYYKLPVITLPPFSPITDNFHCHHLELMKEAQVVVVPAIPFGPGNLRNLKAVEEMISSGLKVLLLDSKPVTERDYCGGKAEAIYTRIKEKGALVFPDSDSLVSYIHHLEIERAV